MAEGNGNGTLDGAVIAVAGAAGPAGRATLLRLAEAGATVVGADADAARLAEAVDAARYAHGGATVIGDTVDLLDLQATRDWADHVEKDFGRVDGVVHLVGGWRGSASFAETDLADWELLEKLLIRTVQHTSLAFHDALTRSDRGRFLLISAAGASKPTAGNAAYAAVEGRRRGLDARPRRRLPQGGGRRGSAAGGCDPGGEGAGARRDARRATQREVRGLHGRHGPGRCHRRRLGPARQGIERDPSVADREAVNPPKTDARRHHDPDVRGFASDNYAGAHPEILAALALANGGHQIAYGEDDYTANLQQIIRAHFGPTAEAFPVFNGTGANVVALQAVTDRWGAVICAESAHINVDEGGAPERMGGLKLLTVPTPDGKLTPELIDRQAFGWDDEHRAMPQVVSITQNTELGTLYTPDEIRAICDHAHERGMKVHLDGSRIANAAASLDVPMRTFTNAVGVDILSLGGTKNGALFGEAVVVLNQDAVSHMKHLRKLSMQLASKMRFVSVQLEALLAKDLWLRNARHANEMAQRLAEGVRAVHGVEILYPVQANAVFARLPHDVSERLQKRYRFYFWNEAAGDVRWMCAFDTREEDVDGFVAALKEEMAR